MMEEGAGLRILRVYPLLKQGDSVCVDVGVEATLGTCADLLS